MAAAYSLPRMFTPKPLPPDTKPRLTVCNDFLLPEDIYEKNLFLAYYHHLKTRPDLLILLDKTRNIAADYQPQDLVSVKGALKLRAEAAEAFNTMVQAAQKDGITLVPQSAYRGYKYQDYIYNRSLKLRGREYTDKYIAAPGHSQHQLGLAIDINDMRQTFENSPASAWLAKHAGEYGYSMSFPKGDEDKTGFTYEPWHYRYITRAGTDMQRDFFNDSQYDMLSFFAGCFAVADI